MKIGIINSGGDVPGLNTVIASAVRAGQKYGDTFVGFIRGWEGVLADTLEYIDLDLERIRPIWNTGGTILHSVNKGGLPGKVGEGEYNDIADEILQKVKTNLAKLDIDAIIVIGGDGTLAAAAQLIPFGIKLIAIPKTIDNDLNLTDRTLGFSTAVDTIADSLQKLHTTAESHERLMVIETMGRYAGWLALEGGLVGGAAAILLPEFSFSYESLYKFILQNKAAGNSSALIVVAEGATLNNQHITQHHETNREDLLGGIGAQVAAKLTQMSNGELESRSIALGHLQRGGAPNAQDIALAQTFASKAIQALHEGQSGKMVAWQGTNVNLVDIIGATSQLKQVTRDTLSYQTARNLGIFLGDN